MNVQEAQKLFYDFYDQWKIYHDAAQELRSKLSKEFSNVYQGGTRNPSLGVMAILEALEAAENRLQAKMAEVIDSIRE